jgi:hypothetical protein
MPVLKLRIPKQLILPFKAEAQRQKFLRHLTVSFDNVPLQIPQ